MFTALEEMANAVQNAPSVLQKIKTDTSRGILGYFFPVVPEELIHAAGLHPVQIYPHFQESITAADAHLQHFFCSYLRAVWDQVLKGKYPYLDGIIIPRSCESVTFLFQTWKRHNPFGFIDYLNVPWKRSPETIRFFAKELQRIKQHLESFTGREITLHALNESIGIFNHNRSLLRKAFELREAENSPFSGMDAFNMVMSGFILDKREHSRLMEQLLAEAGGKPDTSPVGDVRLLLSGGCVIDTKLLEMITSSGAEIVADDFNNGTRSFQQVVREGIDPLTSLAEAYSAVPCGFNTTIGDRFAFIENSIARHRVDGVLFAINKYCETEKFDYPLLDQKIRERFKIPAFLIETDYLCSMEPLKTRVEAFIEMLGDEEI